MGSGIPAAVSPGSEVRFTNRSRTVPSPSWRSIATDMAAHSQFHRLHFFSIFPPRLRSAAAMDTAWLFRPDGHAAPHGLDHSGATHTPQKISSKTFWKQLINFDALSASILMGSVSGLIAKENVTENWNFEF